jgi:hypothetical protein
VNSHVVFLYCCHHTCDPEKKYVRAKKRRSAGRAWTKLAPSRSKIQLEHRFTDFEINSFFVLTMTKLSGIAAVTVLCSTSTAFVNNPHLIHPTQQSSARFAVHDRRSFFFTSAATAAAFLTISPPLPALAIPMVSTPEFESVLRDSARSVQVVEFSGPRSTIATVRLVDGTTFGINDIVDSSTDPRSPLSLAATLRQYKVPCKFTMLEAALSSVPKKKKLYQNDIVQKAAEKEKLRKLRMQQDEDDRLAALYQLEEQEAKSQ